MSEPSAESGVAKDKDGVPFKLRDVTLSRQASNIHPIFGKIDEIRKQCKFMIMLAASSWKREYYLMAGFGIIAFVLGSLSTDVLSGGDTSIRGMDGLFGIGSFSFFQMLLSIAAWIVFMYFVWVEFPVMRIHSITLMLLWNGMILANVFFHQKNQNFPEGSSLSDMMYGTLIMLVVVFFSYFFWKAVTDTRDLYVQIHHVHEDVRVMEQNMYEYSLNGWGAVLLGWFSAAFISAWSGVNFIATRNNDDYFALFLHITSGILVIPLFLGLIWYPQRMLGITTKISTSAALTAEIEMQQGQLNLAADAKCPECSAAVDVSLQLDGQIAVPCKNPACETFGVIGSVCLTCGDEHPSRFNCQSCNTNIPYVDTIPDTEAW